MAVKNCHERQTERCAMQALDQTVVDFSMVQYAIEAVVFQWRVGEIVMDIKNKLGKCRSKFYSSLKEFMAHSI